MTQTWLATRPRSQSARRAVIKLRLIFIRILTSLPGVFLHADPTRLGPAGSNPFRRPRPLGAKDSPAGPVQDQRRVPVRVIPAAFSRLRYLPGKTRPPSRHS